MSPLWGSIVPLYAFLHRYRPAGAEDDEGDVFLLHRYRPAGAEDDEGDVFLLHRYRPAGAEDDEGDVFLLFSSNLGYIIERHSLPKPPQSNRKEHEKDEYK